MGTVVPQKGEKEMNLFSIAAKSGGMERVLLLVLIIALFSAIGYRVYMFLSNCFAPVINAL